MPSPYIKCTHHGVVKGYNVCIHVCNNEQIKVVIPPTDKCMGLITCGKPPIVEMVRDMKVICEICAADKGMISKDVIIGGVKIHESIIEDR